jgi:hypothetical protein
MLLPDCENRPLFANPIVAMARPTIVGDLARLSGGFAPSAPKVSGRGGGRFQGETITGEDGFAQ